MQHKYLVRTFMGNETSREVVHFKNKATLKMDFDDYLESIVPEWVQKNLKSHKNCVVGVHRDNICFETYTGRKSFRKIDFFEELKNLGFKNPRIVTTELGTNILYVGA